MVGGRGLDKGTGEVEEEGGGGGGDRKRGGVIPPGYPPEAT